MSSDIVEDMDRLEYVRQPTPAEYEQAARHLWKNAYDLYEMVFGVPVPNVLTEAPA